MDNKVVNRHVLKAINSMGLDSIPISLINLEVRYTMRNNNPVSGLESKIESSLKNLTIRGILKESINASDEKEYGMNLPLSPPLSLVPHSRMEYI